MPTNPLLEDCRDYCESAYNTNFEIYLTEHTSGPIDQRERDARRNAIIKTAIAARERFESLQPSEVWRFVQKAHIKRFAGVDIEPEAIDLINSARQSWVKASGHAFEEMVKKECNEALDETDIVILLQRDLTELLGASRITNYQEDLEWLKEECKHDVFDLFVARMEDEEGKFKVFGCIQAKTSIRERVAKDREPSIRAMERKFWSLIFIFNDGFLKMPKFINMINGGSQEYPENGWHAAYNYGDICGGRIWSIRKGLATFVDDALRAEEAFNGERRAFVTTKYPEI